MFEILTVSGKVRRLISEGASYDERYAAVREGNFVTMRENCRDLVLRGETTAAEAAKAINSTVD